MKSTLTEPVYGFNNRGKTKLTAEFIILNQVRKFQFCIELQTFSNG